MSVEERGTIRFIQVSRNSDEPPESSEEVMDFVLSVCEFLVLRGTDDYPFSILQPTENYRTDNFCPRKKLKVKFFDLSENRRRSVFIVRFSVYSR